MTYATPIACPACGTAVPSQDVRTRLVECRACRRRLDTTDLCQH